MIRTLQKRFIAAAMAAVALLVIVLIGAINITNAVTTERQVDRLLTFLAHTSSRAPAERGPREGWIDRPFDEDTRMSALYFTALVGNEDVRVDVHRIASVSEEEAQAYTQKAVKSGKTEGRLDRFRYRATPRDGDTLYVFLDISAQVSAMLRLAVLSASAGILVLGVMLLVVWLLSKQTIRPIAVNMEKQKQFVTDAGHELKTPIAIILANIEALELHSGESKWSRNIREQAARLTDLTQNMLTLAKAEESKKQALSEVSLSLLVREYAEMFREPMEMRALTLSAEIAEGVTVRAERAELARVLSVLLDNAARYAKEGSMVALTLTAAQLRIENECEDLPTCPPEKLFDRFYRADSARTGGGYGIGLSAAHAILAAYGADITAEYIGTEKIAFTVTFG